MWTLARCSYSIVSLKQLKHECKAHWFHVGFYHIKHRFSWQISILVRVYNFFHVLLRCHIDVKVVFHFNSCDVQSKTSTLIKRFDLDHVSCFESIQHSARLINNLCVVDGIWNIWCQKKKSYRSSTRYEFPWQYIFHIPSTTHRLLFTILHINQKGNFVRY